MPDNIEDFAYAIGGAIVSPGLGTAELLVALLVACAFLASAVQTWLGRHRGGHDWRGRRF
jgi:hypothetical protein